jgi:hypothetical protein
MAVGLKIQDRPSALEVGILDICLNASDFLDYAKFYYC